MPDVLVFFTHAPHWRLWRGLRLLWLRPAMWPSVLLAPSIAFITRSPLTHVAVALGGTTLSPVYTGSELWPTTTYATLAKRLRYILSAPANASRVDWAKYPLGQRRKIWPSVQRGLMGGIGHADDCVQVARSVLAQCGYPTPERITTPAQLKRWLEDHHGFTAHHVDT